MPRNLEIKSRYSSPARAKRIARKIGSSAKGTLSQTDTYFKVHSGRLKLREINGKKFELIYYRRPNARSTRYSDYTIIPVQDPRPVKLLFQSLLGVLAIVKKKRALFLYRNARIHVDSVNHLGTFIEFEVVVRRGKRQAEKLMQFLMGEFDIDQKMLLGGSYSDLIH
ncbi:MAG: class IV adenylate cyclase [Ignavibacteriales bacterium]|nr:class IV adenylate cyclase [Ignavibacteriales bacterium]